jgi:hypothetical protein
MIQKKIRSYLYSIELKQLIRKIVHALKFENSCKKNKKSHDEMLLKKFKLIENILFFQEKLWILESNQLKLNIIKEIHDQSVLEHLNVRYICKYFHKWYYWSQAKQSIKRYIRNCHICKRFKTIRNRNSDLLNFLFISNRSWINIIMNFVIELLDNRKFNVILMMIDRFIKMHHYVFCIAEEDETFAEETIKLLINHVWKLHAFSNTIISNRDFQFVLLVWKTVCKTLKINVKLSTAFHFETNDQTEIVNQEMKRYLRSYCNYQ